jgi:hypothetical protein
MIRTRAPPMPLITRSCSKLSTAQLGPLERVSGKERRPFAEEPEDRVGLVQHQGISEFEHAGEGDRMHWASAGSDSEFVQARLTLAGGQPTVLG